MAAMGERIGKKKATGRSPDCTESSLRQREGTPACNKKAIEQRLQDEVTEYHQCGVCGCTSGGVLPQESPICGTKVEAFMKID
ncbi:MAG: hypothetical protein WBB22_09525 [Anaerolineae bacterium]